MFAKVGNIVSAENMGNANGGVNGNNANSNLPDVPEDDLDDAPLLPGMEGYQEPEPPEIEIPEEPELPDVDVPEEYGIIGTEEENASTVYIDTPDYVVVNGNVVNNTTAEEVKESPDIVLNDIGAYPLQLPDLKDTHLSWRDLRHWRDLFPKFMAFEDRDNVVYVENLTDAYISYISTKTVNSWRAMGW